MKAAGVVIACLYALFVFVLSAAAGAGGGIAVAFVCLLLALIGRHAPGCGGAMLLIGGLIGGGFWILLVSVFGGSGSEKLVAALTGGVPVISGTLLIAAAISSRRHPGLPGHAGAGTLAQESASVTSPSPSGSKDLEQADQEVAAAQEPTDASRVQREEAADVPPASFFERCVELLGEAERELAAGNTESAIERLWAAAREASSGEDALGLEAVSDLMDSIPTQAAAETKAELKELTGFVRQRLEELHAPGGP